MVWFGLISYPLYLWHWPLLSFGRIINDEPLSIFPRLALIAASIGLAWLTYIAVERPIRFGQSSSLKVAASVLLMTIIGSAGLTTYLRDGLAFRFPPFIRGILTEEEFSYKEFSSDRTCTIYGSPPMMSLCLEKERPSIFVIGDSHAERIVFGLSFLQKKYRFGLDYAIGCGNAPYLVFGQYGDDSWCGSSQARLDFNKLALTQIGIIKPEVVILHARWAYNHYRTNKDFMI